MDELECMKGFHQLQEVLDQCTSNILFCAEGIGQICSKDSQTIDRVVTDLRHCMVNCCEISKKGNDVLKKFQDVNKRLAKNKSIPDEELEELLKFSANNYDTSDCKQIKDFDDLIKNGRTSEEVLLIDTAAKSARLCPITKKEIILPVHNNQCLHVYERDAIMSYIDAKKKAKKAVNCPFLGCNAVLSAENLVEGLS